MLLLPAQLLQVRAQDRKPGLQILRLRELPLIVAHAVLAWDEDDIGRINLRHILRIVSRAAGHNPVGKTELAAKLLNVKVVTCFLGSPIWAMWYSFPQTTPEMVEAGFQKIKELWTPIFDIYDECGVKLALEVHPTEIAFDYYSTKRLLETLDYRPTLGLNFDPSHLLWQGVDPQTFLHDFADRIYHVHLKDVKLRQDGRAGILGSHIEFGDTRRGWNFVSLGHGDVDFDGIIRELNQMGYHGPLCVEWEDSGMDRIEGATEAAAFVRKVDFKPSTFKFDDAISNK